MHARNQCIDGWIWPSSHLLTASICGHGSDFAGLRRHKGGGRGYNTFSFPAQLWQLWGIQLSCQAGMWGAQHSRGFSWSRLRRSQWVRKESPVSVPGGQRRGEGNFMRKRRSSSLCLMVGYWCFMFLWVIAVWMVVLIMLFFPSGKEFFSSDIMGERRWWLVTIAYFTWPYILYLAPEIVSGQDVIIFVLIWNWGNGDTETKPQYSSPITSSVDCLCHLCSGDHKCFLRSCVVKICWKDSAFASCLLLLSVILNLPLIFFFLLQRFFLAYFISVKLSPPFSYLSRCLYFCLSDLPQVLAVELVPCGQAPTPACSLMKFDALYLGICIRMGQISGGFKPCRICAAFCFICVKSENCRVCCRALQHNDR